MRHTPLCGGIEVKKDKAQGRGFDPRPMEVGHSRGPGEPVVQPATASIPQEEGGERGCGRYVFSASHLTHPPLDQHLPTNKRTDNEANDLTGDTRSECTSPPGRSCGSSAGYHP